MNYLGKMHMSVSHCGETYAIDNTSYQNSRAQSDNSTPPTKKLGSRQVMVFILKQSCKET